MSAECVSCQEALLHHVDDSMDEECGTPGPSTSNCEKARVVPDDVGLSCGCHFHWQCLLDDYIDSNCPHCQTHIKITSPSGIFQILCNLKNEGGLQSDLDILPILQEEAFLRARPAERKCRAFLELCREGDVAAVVDLLQSCGKAVDEDDAMEENDDDLEESDKSIEEILRYQDPLGDMQSALHAAVLASNQEIVWLLLLLASEYPENQFPTAVLQEASNLEIARTSQAGLTDIRSLKDSTGRTAEQLAADMNGVWHGWLGNSRLSI